MIIASQRNDHKEANPEILPRNLVKRQLSHSESCCIARKNVQTANVVGGPFWQSGKLTTNLFVSNNLDQSGETDCFKESLTLEVQG